jgi:hypothetical protein
MVVGFLLSLVALATFLMFTGYVSRSYEVLKPDEKVKIANDWLTLTDVALKYQPQFYMRPDTTSPNVLMLWWHAVDDRTSNTLALIYHVTWEDEILPNPLLHQLYRIYRAIYYGMPVRDIEYVQINISYIDGTIQRVRYEGTFADNYDSLISEHKIIKIISHKDGVLEYSYRVDGSIVSIREIDSLEVPLRFGVASWSHQFVLLDPEDILYTQKLEMPLVYLDDDNYRRYKFARKSQGDYVTHESSLVRFASIVLFICFLGLPYIFWRAWRLVRR